jgi:hypothetical protein
VKSGIENMIVHRLVISMRVLHVGDVAKPVTLQEIVKPICPLHKEDTEAKLPIVEIYKKKWMISWLKSELLEQVVDTVNPLDVLKVVNLILGNNLLQSLHPSHHGYVQPKLL